MNIIKTSDAPAAIGPYSQGIEANGFIYTSGQLGINPNTGELQNSSIEAETEQSCKNVLQILKVAGSDASKVVKTTVFIKNMADFSKINEIYSKYFISNPARSCVEVAALPKNANIEIEAIAIK